MPVRLNLYDLLQRGQKVWVQNATNPIGVISLTLASGAPFPIPKTRDPICLSEQMSPEDLTTSQSLRISIQKGFLRLVPDPHAERYYAQTKKDPDKALDMQEDILRRKVAEAPEAKEISVATEQVQVAPHVQQMCLEFRHSAVTDEEIVEKLEAEWDGFSQNDVGYITANVGRATVVRWISHKLTAPPPLPEPEPEPEVEDKPKVAKATRVTKRKPKAAAKPKPEAVAKRKTVKKVQPTDK